MFHSCIHNLILRKQKPNTTFYSCFNWPEAFKVYFLCAGTAQCKAILVVGLGFSKNELVHLHDQLAQYSVRALRSLYHIDMILLLS